MEHTVRSYQEQPYRAQGGSSLTLWFGILAGPIAWIISLNLAYNLVQVACDQQSFLTMHLVSAGTLAMALFGGYVALREWNAIGAGWLDEDGGVIARRRSMSALGLLNGALFSFVIFGQWMANLAFGPCMAI